MTIGTGLFVFGGWLVLAAAYMAPSVTEIGVKRATTNAWLVTIIGLIVTAINHPFILGAIQ